MTRDLYHLPDDSERLKHLAQHPPKPAPQFLKDFAARIGVHDEIVFHNLPVGGHEEVMKALHEAFRKKVERIQMPEIDYEALEKRLWGHLK